MTVVVTHETQTLSHEAPESPLLYRLAGLAFATVLPALFWVSVIAMLAPLAGTTPSAMALIMTGCAIGVFLGSVCAPLVLGART